MENLLNIYSSRRSGILICMLLCCMLVFSACSIFGTGKTRTLSSKKNTPLSQINASLVEQGQQQIQTFALWIGLMQQYKGDISKYQQELIGSQQQLALAKTDSEYEHSLQILNQQVDAIKVPALRIEATNLDQQLIAQANAWGANHTFHDTYNGTTYQLGYEYGPNGVAGWTQDDLSSAQTLSDYLQAASEANTFLSSFQAYKANTSDKTPWDQPHQTDYQMMKQYRDTQGKVVVISLSEQAMRIYDNGKLVKAFQVTTGRPEKPSPPGSWQVEEKQSPTVFKSDEPQGSPYWYPDTPITYAMLYHSGGYFIHDSWWRDDYGPNTQFPHLDSGGDSFSFDGSHGCVNVSTANAGWIYDFVHLNTSVIIY
jgi:hypothetical protein